MGKEALEHAKTTPDSEPAKTKPSRDHDASDKLGTLANSELSPDQIIERSRVVVKDSFVWFSSAAAKKLDNELRPHLHEEDEPHWFAALAKGLFEMAIGAGAAGAGAFLAKKAAAKLGADAGEGITEFMKVMFEGGLGAGIEAGRSKLGDGKDDNVIDPFINAQIAAVDKCGLQNQTEFTMNGQDAIDTVAKANAAREACAPAHLEEVAQKQYEISRDAWLSYLAQSKFGAIGPRGGAVQPAVESGGSTTTNMSDNERRKRTNQQAPGFVPAEGPDLRKTQLGEAPGVLVVGASLPAIVAGLQMTGRPTVHTANLNGVNGKIREQYENQPLSALAIPRQLVLVVDDGPTTFELGFNEKGELGGVPRSGALHDWLVARSTVAHPENAAKSDFAKVAAGAKLLLDDLVATSIKK